VAVTSLSEFISRAQELVPAHAPLHPARCVPGPAAGSRVTEAPLAKMAEQGVLFMSQLMPDGLLVTVPAPVMLRTCTSALKGPADDPPVTVCWCGLQPSSSVMLTTALLTPLAAGT